MVRKPEIWINLLDKHLGKNMRWSLLWLPLSSSWHNQNRKFGNRNRVVGSFEEERNSIKTFPQFLFIFAKLFYANLVVGRMTFKWIEINAESVRPNVSRKSKMKEKKQFVPQTEPLHHTFNLITLPSYIEFDNLT